MNTQSNPQTQGSVWKDENVITNLRLRVKTFYNADYFERILLPLLDLPPSARVLDVGCGNGGLLFTLAGSRPDLRITGVDPEAESLENAAQTAAENGWTNLAFEQGDGHQLAYENELFDAVVCQTVLTHVRDAERVVAEMARVLKPNGVFMAAEYTDMGEYSAYSNVDDHKRNEAWLQKYFRLARLLIRGKKPSVAAMTSSARASPTWQPWPGWMYSMCASTIAPCTSSLHTGTPNRSITWSC